MEGQNAREVRSSPCTMPSALWLTRYLAHLKSRTSPNNNCDFRPTRVALGKFPASWSIVNRVISGGKAPNCLLLANDQLGIREIPSASG